MVRQEVESKLAEFSAAHNVPVAFDNVEFSKPADNVWMEIFFHTPTRVNHGLSAERITEYGGFQINVHGPLGVGVGDVNALAYAVAALFPVLPKVGVTSVEAPPVVGRPLPDDDSIFVPVTVRYRAEF